jgi:phosphorylase kinase alpha/beta subunit
LRELFSIRGIDSLAIDNEPVSPNLLDTLIGEGDQALATILPAECIDLIDYRAYDAALLFLIYPLNVVSPDHQNAILANVETHLRGEYGIRRYLGDSFWCANYDELMSENTRTSNVSEDMSARDALVKPGQEAQWCVFDPIMSAIYGQRYLASGDPVDAQQQRAYFNRALSQLTGPDSGFREFLCPELYYLKRDRYVPNDVTPLLWTQVNLLIAFKIMEESLAQ